MASTALAMRALRLAITNVSSVQYTVIQRRCVLGSGNHWVPMCPIGFPGNCSERDWNRNVNSCDWHESSIFTFAIFVELLLLLLLLISFSHELLFYVIRQMETFPHPTFSKRVFSKTLTNSVPVSDCIKRCFFEHNNFTTSQGSVAARLMCDGIFNYFVTRNLLLSLSAIENRLAFGKVVGANRVVPFFRTRCSIDNGMTAMHE